VNQIPQIVLIKQMNKILLTVLIIIIANVFYNLGIIHGKSLSCNKVYPVNIKEILIRDV